MTSTNKVFTFNFITPSEDQKVHRVLSGRHPDIVFSLLLIFVFDSDTQTNLQAVAAAHFNAYYGATTSPYSVNKKVHRTHIAYILRNHY